jgi:hypothetical protein
MIVGLERLRHETFQPLGGKGSFFWQDHFFTTRSARVTAEEVRGGADQFLTAKERIERKNNSVSRQLE